MFGGASHPDETAKFLADLVNASPYKNDFYVWYAVGTRDVRIDQTHNQALAMGKLTNTFNSSNFSYHQKEGGQHDFNAVWEFIYNAFPFFYPPEQVPVKQTYTRTSKIADVMADPSFEGFGRLLFPVNTGYWSGSTLEDLRLTWYNYIDPDKTVEIVNTLKSRADVGKTIFLDIYTEAEKVADPAKKNTGLFFFEAVMAGSDRPSLRKTAASRMPLNYRRKDTTPLRSSIGLAGKRRWTTWPGRSPSWLPMPTNWASTWTAIPSGAAVPVPGWRRRWEAPHRPTEFPGQAPWSCNTPGMVSGPVMTLLLTPAAAPLTASLHGKA